MPPIKYKDNNISIREQWKLFCDKLFNRVLEIENETQSKISKSRNLGQSYEERKQLKDKLQRCETYKKKIKNSAINKKFIDVDYELIDEKGFDYYFRYKDGTL